MLLEYCHHPHSTFSDISAEYIREQCNDMVVWIILIFLNSPYQSHVDEIVYNGMHYGESSLIIVRREEFLNYEMVNPSVCLRKISKQRGAEDLILCIGRSVAVIIVSIYFSALLNHILFYLWLSSV